MKRHVVTGAIAVILLGSLFAFAQPIPFLTVTAPPNSEAGGSATVDDISNLYLTISPSAEIPRPTSRVLVYEDGSLLGSYPGRATNQRLIATYSANKQRSYTLVVQETDGLTLTAQLLYD